MSDGYTPQRGSIAEKVIERLGANPKPLDVNVIADLVGCKRTSVGNSLKGAVDAGALVVTKEDGRLRFSLPGEAPPRDGKLTIACWSDGDIAVRGGVVCADDSVTYTREQLLQLFHHLTTPHIALATPAAAQG